MSQLPDGPRSFDHMVLPTADLAVARTRLEALGFTVAPVADHPFGTKNACVYLADGIFLEPLAIGQRETCEAEARSGNAFVARDQAYRFRNGGEGFSALVFATDDADADDAEFRRIGVSGGAPLSFTRTFEMPSGETGEAGFRLAFSTDLRAPDAFFFTCERTRQPAIDRSALERHRNGVTGVSEIVLVETNPSDFQCFFQDLLRQRDVEAGSFGVSLAAANGSLSILTPDGLKAGFGEASPMAERGVRLVGIVFTVEKLRVVETALMQDNLVFRRQGRRLVVSPTSGQGAIFAFEEKP